MHQNWLENKLPSYTKTPHLALLNLLFKPFWILIRTSIINFVEHHPSNEHSYQVPGFYWLTGFQTRMVTVNHKDDACKLMKIVNNCKIVLVPVEL